MISPTDWYLYDDTCVTPVLNPSKKLIASEAYLLFYKRRNFPDSELLFSNKNHDTEMK